jgi:hypothetical protein
MSATITLAKNASGNIVHIEAVIKAKSESFFCAGCGLNVIAVKSDARKKDWHFRHPPSSDITTCRNKALHDLAVQILVENTKVVISKDLSIEYDTPRKEVSFFSRRSDVTVNYLGQDVHFEVYVTHDCEEEKLEVYRNNKIKGILIDLSDPSLRSATAEEIKEKVLNSFKNKKVIYWEDKKELLIQPVEKIQYTWPRISLLDVLLFIGIVLGLRFIYKRFIAPSLRRR